MNNRQPFLHDLNVLLAAPMQVWSGHDGQLRRSGGVQGIYCADTRVIDEAVLTVNGEEPEPVGSSSAQGHIVSFQALIRTLGSENPDPLVSLTRRRSISTDRVSEEIILRSDLSKPVTAVVEMVLGSDFSPLESVKAGGRAHPVLPELRGDAWQAAAEGVTSLISGPGAQVERHNSQLRLRWDVRIPARGTVRVGWDVQAKDSLAPFVAAEQSAPPAFRVRADDRRLTALAERALADLQGLRMSPVSAPQDAFLAAGAPWFFTLFGRDSLIAAEMLLPVDPSLAAGTLRTLAARQGTQNDPLTAEQPGKILHEVRRGELRMPADASNGEIRLPPVYFGTVDATLLWISLLHDAWKWGMPEEEVKDLIGNLEVALLWLRDWADPDGDGFLEYIDETGYGLANQGWKDSADSIRWSDGSLATGPIALAEVQGYAYQAATNAADLLDAFGLPGAQEWRDYAEEMALNFREAFWCRDELGPYPAIALDVDKRPVDGVASNMGHLLGTGILNAEESELVAHRIMHPTMFSGYGVRTLDTGNGAYWPLRYHSGSVWAHDTAMTLAGLTKAGYADQAALLAAGLMDAAEIFDYRLPELFSGHSQGQGGPQPYPASCRPQAWAAASAIPLMLAILGLTPQGPGLLPSVSARVPAPFGACTFDGLQAGGLSFTVDVDRHGGTTVIPA
ncbi:amylo-alpha-1,6-glucosidase [Arthrobacter sp. CDRTa11]|uniref:amylo-alpha-1,6-glucosidase n=1 Tax=Arthrobacter sp. CDRTa11 TaxID=2651199 RepID=UPI00226588DA|nr:glycogen debranching N-terminal domain-containing protein [Arthrobacter sp. CDRTa11]UZX04810.1 amylo-alpha-1,6-glucosidase [Arthrobacter sp. CDRTa11]